MPEEVMPEQPAEPSTLDKAKALAQNLGEWVSVLQPFSPYIPIAISMAESLVDWARKEQIDPGPFEENVARIRQKVADGLADDIAYRERHGE